MVGLLDARQVASALAKQVMGDLKLHQDPRWLIKYYPDPLVGTILYEVLDRHAREYVTGVNDELDIGIENARELHAKIMQEMIR